MIFLRNIGHFISQKGNTLKEALLLTTFLIEGLTGTFAVTEAFFCDRKKSSITFFLKKDNHEVMLKDQC